MTVAVHTLVWTALILASFVVYRLGVLANTHEQSDAFEVVQKGAFLFGILSLLFMGFDLCIVLFG